ncbi:hypothetical protein PTE30175_04038 [Pandoraea terrae]|uniref:DUF1697 domain-containing protein n=2 Tax=Pandoraea terrae TaxID=1537710 RepID=A0A5E4XWJ5_9BURK|nr:hypothetical protein PTE30175_04038 [Pandoraea terrae]
MCESVGFSDVRTYIASGNVVFKSRLSAKSVKAALKRCLEAYAGKPVGVLIRTGQEMEEVLAANPFKSTAPNRTVAIFLDTPPPAETLDGVSGQQTEEIALGKREIYVHYGTGMADSKLKIPVAKTGTARNMNTVAKLAEMSAE